MDNPAGPAPLRADPTVLAHAAARLLDATEALAERTRPLVAQLSLTEFAYGNLATRLPRSHELAIADAQGTLDRVRAALAGDADRLYQIGFAFAEADRRAGERARSWGRGPR